MLRSVLRRQLSQFSAPVLANPGTKYGDRFTVTLIPGDGTGKELTESIKKVFMAINAPIDWEEVNMTGYAETDESSKLIQAIESIKRNKIALKGKLHTSMTTGRLSLNLRIRKQLEVFASVTSISSKPGIKTRHPDVDIVVIRENIEGEYSGLEHQPFPGVVESLKICTRAESERIIKFAFDYALKHGRKKITCIHKANIMKLSDGLFLKVFRETAEKYASYGLVTEDMIVDNASMQMVSNPQQFDVLVAPNLFGNIATNICASLIGGPGLISGYSIGREYAIFEHSGRREALDIAGKNQANPISPLLCSCIMLEHLGLMGHGQAIRKAIDKVLIAGQYKTHDLHGTTGTEEMTQAIIDALPHSKHATAM